MAIKDQWYCRMVGVVAGLSLALPNMFWQLAPLQLLAFIPVLYLALARHVGRGGMLVTGFYMGLAYTLPQLIMLRLPLPITVVLLVELIAVITLVVWVGTYLASYSAVLGSIAFASVLVVVDWAGFTFVPIWGTAQSIARCWSAWPDMIWFTSLTGITGVLFVVGLLQGLVVNVIIGRNAIKCLVTMTGLGVLIVGGAVTFVRSRCPVATMNVAAVGWVCDAEDSDYDTDSPQWFDKYVADPVAAAANRGAQLVVFPELAFEFGSNGRQRWIAKFAGLAERHGVCLALGYYNNSRQENRMLFMDRTGLVVDEYTKTHLTPFEPFTPGTGDLRQMEIDGLKIGGMICQDDNFTDMARRYSRRGIQVMAVPTLDWETVRYPHLQNSVHRAVESRYAVVRAAMNGVSAVISPTGHVLASCDHFKHVGPSVITAEVDIFDDQPTFYARHGDWPVACAVGFLLAWIGYNCPNRRPYCRKVSKKIDNCP